ncbi:O-antigen ligase family protein [Pontibacter sp. JH31]|uniref:O-antigen ligase family protein n=1 Tax=Pontibacter aquaedesilientis TaxID=2766980 RepID=A0ABR7XH25_9BACT|nr:O-antigen ligase family protein [Pontibacter aquaedesilientis]MBD1397609.1 O-antigen ligase family protein [Pontibacter aquaedesilientis]
MSLKIIAQTFKSLTLHRAYFGCILLMALTIPFHYKINNVAIGLLSIVWVYGILKKELQLKRFFFNAANILVLSIFFLHLIGLFYSEHRGEGIKSIETQLPFFAFPFLLFPLRKFYLKKSNTIFNIFLFGCFISSLIALLGALLQTIETKTLYTLNPITGVNEYHFFYHQLTSHIGLHAVYYSLYIAFSHLLVTQTVLHRFSSRSIVEKIYLIFLLVYFPIILYLSHSLTIIFTWIACLILLIIYSLISHQLIINRRLLLTAVVFTFPFICFMGYRTVQEKINIETVGVFSFSDGQHSGSWGTLNVRLAKWICAYEVFEENFWTGTGTGDDMSALLEKYEQKEFWIGIQNRFDPHNQFLNYGVELGIFAVTVFISILLLMFRQGIISRNVELLTFLILFLTFSLTESTLASNKGIVFFVFFSLCFVHMTGKSGPMKSDYRNYNKNNCGLGK